MKIVTKKNRSKLINLNNLNKTKTTEKKRVKNLKEVKKVKSAKKTKEYPLVSQSLMDLTDDELYINI